MDKHILIFGTSITYGAWDSQGGWASRLRNFINKSLISKGIKTEILVYNQGISGAKSTDILKTFEPETEARLGHNRDNEIIIIFDLGINDSIFNASIGTTEVDLDKFTENMKTLIRNAKKYSKNIVVLGLTPADQRVDPMPWPPNGRSFRNDNIIEFNQALDNISREEKVDFIEIFRQFTSNDYSSLLSDGVHLNDKGHEKVYEMVRDYLLENKII